LANPIVFSQPASAFHGVTPHSNNFIGDGRCHQSMNKAASPIVFQKLDGFVPAVIWAGPFLTHNRSQVAFGTSG